MDSKFDELMREITDSRIRHLQVIYNGRVVGLESIGDVVKKQAAGVGILKQYAARIYRTRLTG
jgi:signal-transduction protein with cAMP-binding, CBS, and nucleotidyltransferase domain